MSEVLRGWLILAAALGFLTWKYWGQNWIKVVWVVIFYATAAYLLTKLYQTKWWRGDKNG